MEFKEFMKTWKEKIDDIKEISGDIGEWPYNVNEKGSAMEIILNEGAFHVTIGEELLLRMGKISENRFCIPWEWVEIIVKEAFKNSGE